MAAVPLTGAATRSAGITGSGRSNLRLQSLAASCRVRLWRAFGQSSQPRPAARLRRRVDQRGPSSSSQHLGHSAGLRLQRAERAKLVAASSASPVAWRFCERSARHSSPPAWSTMTRSADIKARRSQYGINILEGLQNDLTAPYHRSNGRFQWGAFLAWMICLI